MLRAIRSVVGAAAVLFGGVLLAQPPKDASADGYFPLKKGTKWTYRVGDNDVTVSVVKTEKVGTEEQYQVDTFVGKDVKVGEAKTSEWYVVRADGVYRTRVKDDKLDPFVKVLPLPVKKGDSWEVNSKLSTQVIKGTLKVVNDKEKVKIQNVDYDTVFVEGKDMDIAGAKTTVRIWFAKDRGIVKEEFLLQGGEKVLLELSNFQAAADAK
ncbi:hypothetical protein [Frigoriglobus tundricola]|uniref:Uncharacterized protein n=1 Tax=Frigoriglobus tundricola TaxID=2774151 RepID=A0A6M5YU99_9BACT|nr:hypothetical protein [Frigoriglobus tundricola]QJW96821.1 hypothetical protein FTUN_4381 [Frigoriglobus tundricola]